MTDPTINWKRELKLSGIHTATWTHRNILIAIHLRNQLLINSKVSEENERGSRV